MNTYHMRRQERQITDQDEIREILTQGRFAVISMCRNNEPYIVTLSYGYDPVHNTLYFHSAAEGLKIEIIKENPNVCATVIDDKGYIQRECAHAFRSAVIYGKISIITDIEEKKHGIEVLLDHLEEDPGVIREKYRLDNEESFGKAAVLRLEIENITGKKGR